MGYPGWIRWWKIKADLMRPFRRTRRGTAVSLEEAARAMREVMTPIIEETYNTPLGWPKRKG